MRQLFQRLREADLKLNREKCNFFKCHIQYLGHLISGEGIEPLPEKLESIKGMPPPTTPSKGGETIFRSDRLLQKICTKICRYSQVFN